jgi:hypothetical protein
MSNGIALFSPSKRLISLWDMIAFSESDVFQAWAALQFRKELHQNSVALADFPKELREYAINSLLRSVGHIEQYAEKWQLVETSGRCSRFKRGLGFAAAEFQGVPIKDLVSAEIVAEISGIQDAFQKELKQRKFTFIPPPLVPFFEQDTLFGEKVNAAFPSAQMDIKESGNCLASGLPTAAIFHLMRVAELGLRSIAKKVKAKIPVQIEFATWGQVIEATEKELDKLKGKSTAKDERRSFYSALVLDIRAFMYLWRNPVMHTRSRYDEHQAQSAFNHVRAFMQRLADKISEVS